MNECTDERDCPPNSVCKYDSTIDGYACACDVGYVKGISGCVLESYEPSPGSSSNQVFARTCLGNVCWCPPGFQDNGDVCIPGSSAPDQDRRPPPVVSTPPPYTKETCAQLNNCDVHADCVYVHETTEYRCVCKPGYEGSGHNCRAIDVPCDEVDICHFNASCVFDEEERKHICICSNGFVGDGTVCYPSSTCEEDYYCPVNSHCVFNHDKQDQECVCDKGYERGPSGDCEFSEEARCGACHQDAECVRKDGLIECNCKDGFEGDGINCRRKPVGCDVLRNCSPFADCTFNYDERMYKCQCRERYRGDGYECEEIITCASKPELCSEDATCKYIEGNYMCKCDEGFFGNGTICKEARKQNEEFLLLNKGRSILSLPFEPSGSNRGQPINIDKNQVAIGIAIDCVEGKVYWSDITEKQILRSKYDGTEFEQFLSTDIKSPEGLAIDWMDRRLYWTDSGSGKINSVHLDTKEVKTVISLGKRNPRGIAVHPWLRKIFWSDWYRPDPKIEWANLDGSDRQVLVKSPKVFLPNSLAIDWDRDELCWADAGTKTIECMDIETKQIRVAVPKCEYPFGLTMTSDRYYWTDWNSNKVETAPKTGSPITSLQLPLGGDDRLYGIVTVSSCPL